MLVRYNLNEVVQAQVKQFSGVKIRFSVSGLNSGTVLGETVCIGCFFDG